MDSGFIFDLDGVLTYHYLAWLRLADEKALLFSLGDKEHCAEFRGDIAWKSC